MHRFSFSCLIFLFFSSILLNAKELKYPVSEIPDSLLKNAKAIVRIFSDEYEMVALDNINENITKAITVFDRSFADYVVEVFPYDNNNIIIKIEASYFDKYGKLLDKKGRSDFKDISWDQYGTLFSDTRYLYMKPLISDYPYTVEYRVTYKHNFSFINPSWFPVSRKNVSIEASSISISTPEKFRILFYRKGTKKVSTGKRKK
jgi:hypothetical protein